MAGNISDKSSVGMPQLDFSNFDNQAFWLFVFLVAVFVVIRVLVMPKMEATLTNRRKIIEEDIQEAEDLKNKALQIKETLTLEIEASREKASEIIRSAKDEVKANMVNALSDIDEKIEEMVSESNQNILEIKKKAYEEVEAMGKNLAPEIVKAVLPGKS